jgi:ABC-type Zn uptake system ZnuABC Zn-binding protein ZnuA
MRLLVSLLSLAGLLVTLAAPYAASQVGAQAGPSPVKVVTTVAPLANILLNVGGSKIELTQIIPNGTDSHTFEPTPSDARALSDANLIVANGLSLEGSTIQLAEANRKPDSRLLLLGDNTITRDQWVFDFSFPAEHGEPNPHLWMNPLYAGRYAELVRDQLVEIDSPNAGYYEENTRRFLERIKQLDSAIMVTIDTIPQSNRKLLTYHDSFAYFAPRYGMTVIGAIQPSDFAEPTPQEVVQLIEQIKREQVPAIFGSEVFPSTVLDQIARESGVAFVDTLRDDDLPGAADAPEHSYFGMLIDDVSTMARALGGSSSTIDQMDPRNTYQD